MSEVSVEITHPEFMPVRRSLVRDEFGLVPVRSAEWNGWVFVNASGDAHAFAAHAGALTELLAPWEIGDLAVAHRHDYTVAANWKLVVENYLECYHCPTIHPELTRVSPPDSGDSYRGAGAWIAGNQDLDDDADTMSLSGASGGVRLPRLDAWQARRVLYVVLLPNLLISAHPDYVLTHRLEPLAPDATRVECEWLFPTAATTQAGFDPAYAVEFWDLTNRQDWAACEGVQRSAGSRGFLPGPLAPDEEAVYHFLATLGRAYREGRSRPREGPLRPERVAWDPAAAR
jgi:glycine betaine catabolism A